MRSDNLRKQYPELARAYDLYLMCRQQQLFHMKVEKDKGKRVEHKVVNYTTGLHSLPEEGGVLDQPYRLMEFFSLFQQGDNIAAQKRLNS